MWRKPRLALADRARRSARSLGQRIGGFSNGMTARLAVATSLINEPDLLICRAGLVRSPTQHVANLIKSRLGREKTLIVIVAQSGRHRRGLNHAAFSVADN